MLIYINGTIIIQFNYSLIDMRNVVFNYVKTYSIADTMKSHIIGYISLRRTIAYVHNIFEMFIHNVRT